MACQSFHPDTKTVKETNLEQFYFKLISIKPLSAHLKQPK